MPLDSIVFPHAKFVLPRRFVIVVLAGPDISRVSATVVPPEGGEAKVVDWVMTRQQDLRPRWKFVIQGTLPEGKDAGLFEVTLTGYTGAGGDTPSNSLKQSVSVAKGGWAGGSLGARSEGEPSLSDIEISYPPNDHVTTPEEQAGGGWRLGARSRTGTRPLARP